MRQEGLLGGSGTRAWEGTRACSSRRLGAWCTFHTRTGAAAQAADLCPERKGYPIRMLLSLVVTAAVALSCVGTTGSDVIEFRALAAGPEDSVAGREYSFTTDLGYTVHLQRAVLHVGALYLNRTFPVLGSQERSCVLPGVYVGEVTTGLDIDVLSPSLQPFPSLGHGTSDRAAAAEVWLTGGRVDAPDDSTVILDLAGIAERGAETYPFEGTLTIGKNRQIDSGDPATPGANPLCTQRIVSPIAVDFVPRDGGALVVRVHPDGWFAGVDFAQLDKVTGVPLYEFRDTTTGEPSTNLYNGIHMVQGVYNVEWHNQ